MCSLALADLYIKINTMGSTFNPQILAEKLTKLNNSQQSIETLSHWCIFHMNKAKQVVETWARQFHCSPPNQRLAYLYLANDILQNSRRKGAEFVGEFWRVLPEALRDVIKNGDDFGQNAAMRLVNIWDERKVFGSQGHILKEEFSPRHSENSPRVGGQANLKLRHGIGNTLDKIVSGYEVIYAGQLDEDVVLNKCRIAISCMEKVEKDVSQDMNSGQFNGSGILGEFQGQHAALKECIEQLKMLETSRASLVSQLREALQDQEFKLDQVRNQLKVAQLLSEQASSICEQFMNPKNVQLLDNQLLNSRTSPVVSKGNGSVERELPGPIVYTRQVPFSDKVVAGVGQDDPKSAAAAIAAQLTSSSSSTEMLTYVLSSLAQEGVIGRDNGIAAVKETHQAEYPPEKRPKLEEDQSSYIPPPPQQPPPPLPPLPYPDYPQSNGSATRQQIVFPVQQPPPSSSPLPLPPVVPLPPYAQFMQAGPASNMQPFTYGPNPQQLPLSVYPLAGPSLPGMPLFDAAPPGYSYPNFQAPDGGFYNEPGSMPMAPMSRQ